MAATPASSIPSSRGHSSGLAIASLVIGIISLLLLFFWPAAIPLGALAVALGTSARKSGGSGVATAGVVCGAISVVVGLVFLVIYLVG